MFYMESSLLDALADFLVPPHLFPVLSVPLVYTSIAIGLAGTTYTALGGLRSVVWADCIQAAIMLACPIMIISKIFHDSKHVSQPLRPLSDMNATLYILRRDFDATTDENMWSVLVACVPYSLVRFGCDQMSVQRYMAGRTAAEAKRIAVVGGCLLLLFFVVTATAALAVLYWYRDCDPLLSGAISNYDQILPYYIKERFPDIKTMRGLFLAGLLSATTSTVSSVVNSNAAMIYMDVIAPYVDLSGRSAVVLMHSLAFASGIVMTLYAMAVPVLGSATRLFVSFYSSASGPFSGLMLLAISSPWVKAKAAAWASLLVCGLQLWHAIGRSLSGVARPKVLYGTLDRCPKSTSMPHATNWSSLEHSSLPERSDVFPLYQISFFWISFIGALLTIFLGTIFSFSKGSEAEIRKNIRLTSPVFLKIWSRLTCFQQLLNMNERIQMACAVTSCDQGEEEYGALEIELLEAVEGRREHKGFK